MSINLQAQQQHFIIKNGEISGGISPKSVVSSGTGLFAAQNMMYRHTVTIYNSDRKQVAKIEDEVRLKEFGFEKYSDSKYKGAPVEGAFTKDGKYLWISNYNMEGEGFEKPGCDACHGDEYDPGFLYKINAETYEIENIVKVGAVPKFLAISDDEKKLLVSNWTSGDVSIIDLESEKEINRIDVGVHPRGVDISSDGKTAFIAVMGSNKIAEINLENYEVSYLTDFGRAPRHIILTENDSVLFVSLNSSNKIAKYNRYTKEKLYCKTNAGPRSMCISPNQQYLYVVNYFDNSFSKIATSKMEVIENVSTADKPIGICGNWENDELWVACYSGKIEIFKDIHLSRQNHLNANVDIKGTKHGFSKNQKESIHKSVGTNKSETKNGKVVMRYSIDHKIQKNFEQNKSENCKYHLIAGSFSVFSNAESRQMELKQEGFHPQIIKGNLNYVSVNCFESREQAESEISSVKSKTGYSVWVLKY